MNLTTSVKIDYHSYLLRIWRDDKRRPWQASLQSTATEQLVHFAGLEALFAFLETQSAAKPGTISDAVIAASEDSII